MLLVSLGVHTGRTLRDREDVGRVPRRPARGDRQGGREAVAGCYAASRGLRRWLPLRGWLTGQLRCEAQKPFPGAVHRRTSVGAVYLLALAPLPASHAAEVTP